MSAFIKTSLYVVFMLAVFCIEHDVPVMLYAKRGLFLANWKFAAYMQNRAMASYRSYQEEVELSHG